LTTVEVTKPLKIDYLRNCNCKPSHLNCLTAKEWMKSQVGVWEFFYESRDVRDKAIHPAVFPIALAKKVISLYTHRGELVVDPFVGSGTTLLAARDLERNCVGFDIYPRYIEFCRKRLAQETLSQTPRQIAVLDDARHAHQYFEPETISLIWTSPPYANLLNRPRLNKSRRGDTRRNDQFMKVEQYGFDERDLGLLAAEKYQKEMQEIFRSLLPTLKPGGHVVINIPDMWWKEKRPGGGRRIPLHINIYHALADAGYEFRNTIIWNRNNIVNRIGIFGWPSNYITMGTTFEYIMDFWKPKT
jgi:DNA modification methylase